MNILHTQFTHTHNVQAHTRVHTQTHTLTNMHMHTHIHRYTGMWMYMGEHRYTQVHAHMHVYTGTYTCARMHRYTHVHTGVHRYIHACTRVYVGALTYRHTGTRTHSGSHPVPRSGEALLPSTRDDVVPPHKIPAWRTPKTAIPIGNRQHRGSTRSPRPVDLPTYHPRAGGEEGPSRPVLLGPHLPQSSSGRVGSSGRKGDAMVPAAPPAHASGPGTRRPTRGGDGGACGPLQRTPRRRWPNANKLPHCARVQHERDVPGGGETDVLSRCCEGKTGESASVREAPTALREAEPAVGTEAAALRAPATSASNRGCNGQFREGDATQGPRGRERGAGGRTRSPRVRPAGGGVPGRRAAPLPLPLSSRKNTFSKTERQVRPALRRRLPRPLTGSGPRRRGGSPAALRRESGCAPQGAPGSVGRAGGTAPRPTTGCAPRFPGRDSPPDPP